MEFIWPPPETTQREHKVAGGGSDVATSKLAIRFGRARRGEKRWLAGARFLAREPDSAAAETVAEQVVKA